MNDPIEPANIKFLRRLVTVLTAVMILGLLVMIGLFVTRLGKTNTVFPTEITLPDGATASAFTQGRDWYAIVTTDDEILIYNRISGTLRQKVTLK